MFRFVLAVLALLVGTERLAGANAPAPYSRPTGAVPGVVIERPSPVAVEREDLLIDCAKDTSPVHASCTFVATYSLYNPTENEEEVHGAFYTVEHAPYYGGGQTQTPGVTAALDGVDVRADVTGEQLERMDAIVREDPEVSTIEARAKGPSLRRAPFALVIAGGRRAQLVFKGALEPTSSTDHNPREGYVLPAIATRHLLGTSWHAVEWDDSEDDYLYLISPVSHWAGNPEVHVEIRRFPENTLTTASPRGGWTTAEEEVGRRRVTVDRTVVRASSRENLRFRLVYKPPFVHNGGPVLGIGPRIAREELRFRLGYEVGLSSNLILAGSAETNFDEYVTAAATLDAATPCLVFIIPSLAIGGGVPVQFRRDTQTRVGARGQLTLAWPLVSFMFPIDYYPVENSSRSHVEGAFLTQISF